MPIAARLEQFPASDRRSAERRKLFLGSTLESTGEEVAIHDISSTGMLIETSAKLEPFDALEIDLPHNGLTRTLIIWNSGHYYGCAFSERISKAAVSAALLRGTPEAEPDRPAHRTPEAAALLDPSPAPAEASATANAGDYEEKWSLGASTRFILVSALLLWALIIGAGIGITRLIEALWR
jgi:hypothetical protein